MVLVVDDEPLVLEVTATMLTDIGCTVITAANGSEALDKLSKNPRIEILITDVNMPGMDGYTLADAAKRVRKNLKIILLSGREDAEGGLPFIRKPFSQDDLARTMARHTGLC